MLNSDLRSSQRSELRQCGIIVHPTSDQLKVCSDNLSCARRTTNESSLVFPTSTLVFEQSQSLQAAARHNNGGSFRTHRSSLESHFKPAKSFTEVQFLIDRSRLFSQSNYLNNSDKDCDWFISGCFIRRTEHG